MSSTKTRVPTGDSWQYYISKYPTSPTTFYDKVDDTIGSHDSDTTYLYPTTGDNGAKVTFTFTALDVPTGAVISKVSVTFVARYVTNSDSVKGILKANGTIYYSSTWAALTTSYASYTRDWATNPNTGAAWTVSDVNGSGSNPLQEFGFQVNTWSTTRVTQVYLTVTYDEVTECSACGQATSGASAFSAVA